MENIFTILFLTYNQEKYVEKSLNGILSQDTSYQYHIYIFDDCSTDNTTEILKRFAKSYPQKITLIINHKNLGAADNCLQSFKYINSKYWSHLEGDDYWIDNQKIQLQIDLLESNPHLIACGHNSYLEKHGKINENDLILNSDFKILPQYDFLDIAEGRFYSQTSAMIYRNIPELTQLLSIKSGKYKKNLGDHFTLLYFSQFGNIGYIDKVMSVYRIHDNGVWTKLGEEAQKDNLVRSILITQKNLNQEFKEKYIGPAYSAATYYAKLFKEKKLSTIKLLKTYALQKSLKCNLHIKNRELNDKNSVILLKIKKTFFLYIYYLMELLKL